MAYLSGPTSPYALRRERKRFKSLCSFNQAENCSRSTSQLQRLPPVDSAHFPKFVNLSFTSRSSHLAASVHLNSSLFTLQYSAGFVSLRHNSLSQSHLPSVQTHTQDCFRCNLAVSRLELVPHPERAWGCSGIIWSLLYELFTLYLENVQAGPVFMSTGLIQNTTSRVGSRH